MGGGVTGRESIPAVGPANRRHDSSPVFWFRPEDGFFAFSGNNPTSARVY